jgi:hypothetical protein
MRCSAGVCSVCVQDDAPAPALTPACLAFPGARRGIRLPLVLTLAALRAGLS